MSLRLQISLCVFLLVFWPASVPWTYAQTNELPSFLQKRYQIAAMPKDWQQWWKAQATGVHLIGHIKVSHDLRSRFLFLINRMIDLHNHRAEGNSQWLLAASFRADMLEIEATYRIGYFSCCSHAWLYEPQMAIQDVNGDDQWEMILTGRYESGSDSYQLEGQVKLVVFLGEKVSVVPSQTFCQFFPPGFWPNSHMIPVILEGTYRYHGMPRLDIAPFNRVRGRLVREENSSDSASTNALIWEQTWFLPTRNEEIQRWYDTGNPNELTEFRELVRRQALYWNEKTNRLEVFCSFDSSFFRLRRQSAHELVVKQGSLEVWQMYFDNPVMQIALHPILPLAVAFTTKDSLAVQPPRASDIFEIYLLNLWAGEQLWVPVQDLAPESWFFSVWSPTGTYALFPDAYGDLLLFRSADLLDEKGTVRDNWYERPAQRLSIVDLPEVPKNALSLHFRGWLGDERIACDLMGKDILWHYEYHIPAQKWQLIAKTVRKP